MKRFSVILGLLFFSLVFYTKYQILNTRYSRNGQVKSAATNISKNVGVWAFLGEYHFSLYGYSSPKALVTIEGSGIYDQTYSDDQGYFQFTNRFSPFSPREACLSAKDQFGRTSPPTCLPPFPVKYDVSIGPVILPPTLSLDKQNYYLGDEIVLFGQTIPDSEVNLSMFFNTKPRQTLLTQNNAKEFPRCSAFFSALFRVFVKPVSAASPKSSSNTSFAFPKFTTKSDDKGNFSISLPSTNFDSYRLFAQTYRESFPSNKSNTLNLQILPWWMIIINFLIFLFSILKPWLIEIAILLEMIVVGWYLINHYLLPHKIARNRALAVRERFDLEIEEKSLMIR